MVTYKYLGKCEARLKVPRPTHRKKDPARVAAFRAELCAKLHAEQIALEQSVHLWVSDEMRFGLQPGLGVSAAKLNLRAAGVIRSAAVRHPTSSLAPESFRELERLRDWVNGPFANATTE